ncbi:class I SAM-dependent methyltransferase [Lachnospiraceae bacterium LCP25S3_G4]
MNELEQYYNKFNENKRLTSRHGQVEFITSMKYIHDFLKDKDHPQILDVGAGTGRYSVQLSNEGYDVTAIELVAHNLDVLKSKKSHVKAHLGTALDLSRFLNESFDVTLVFGPMYHLFQFEEKVKVLLEAKRVTKVGGIILVAYCMNEYSVLTYGFKENNIKECLQNNRLTSDFHVVSEPKDLYDYVRIEDIENIRKAAGLTQVKLIATDGPANYMRPILKEMDEETFHHFLDYHLSTCERPDLIGASAHTLSILQRDS